MEVGFICGLFCLRLRAFGDGFMLVGRLWLIMLWCAVFKRFNFFANFSGPVVAFRLLDPGGYVDSRSSRMARVFYILSQFVCEAAAAYCILLSAELLLRISEAQPCAHCRLSPSL